MNTTEQNITLEIKDLTIGYKSRKANFVIAKNIQFKLHEGELMGIIGINGIGKSTLLRTLGKVQDKLSGMININKKSIEHFGALELASQISIVLTESIASRNMTALELVALGRQPYTNWLGTLSDEDLSKVNSAISMVAIEDLKYKKCHELSDGQLQRVMIARALAQDTPLILLDEPTTHLDIYHKVQILKLLKSIAHQTRKTIIFTTHEIELAIQLCDKMLLIDAVSNHFGQPCELIQKGAFEKLFPSDTILFEPQTGTFRIKK